ncbi:MAG: proteasome accessory factor PafA2 family protein, partial [Acidobacteria bacterium]|nr:proteasome accessory factor PafA2 family protein [Acidobacteriota bacterium]
VPELGLIKNCRDAEDHVYGAQENYEVELARGVWLGLYRAGLTLLMPWLLAMAALALLVQFLVVLVVLVLALGALVGGVLFPRWQGLRWLAELAEADESSIARLFGRSQLVLSYALLGPATTPLALLFELTTLRHLRGPMLAFLVSRPVITGVGTVDRQGRFGLAEKAPAVRRRMRRTISPKGRPIFDTGNLLKQAVAPMSLHLAPLFGLYRRRQRLQLGFGDSNAAQWAEYLKVATTALVLDMAEAGWLEDVPRVRRPIRALHRLVSDPTLEARVAVRGGDPKTALELQRVYLDRADAFVRDAPAASLEAREVVALWRRVVEALEARRFDELFGRVDWITKRTLLEECRGAGGGDVLKTLDLRYHELGDGYLARLEARGLAPVLVAEEEVERAVRRPPEDSPAFFRGALIRKQAGSRVQLRVSWEGAVIGGRL